MLPYLQTLILERCEFTSTWETLEGGFPELQYLHINEAMKLVEWLATESDFPVLRHLVLKHCSCLNEIPSGIGGIETLEKIEVVKCKPSLVQSARRVREEQSTFGSSLLQLYLENSEFQMDENQGLSLKFYTFSNETVLPLLIRNLTLECCRVPRTLLFSNDILPKFQVLNIEYCRFESSVWETFEGVFFQLQYLKVESSHLKIWLATKIHFPVLKHLVIRDCCYLNEIPKDFGGIKTLKIMEVDGCKPSVFESAKKILEEQRQCGNSSLQLRLGRETDVWSSKEDEDVVEEETLICKVDNYGFPLYKNSSKTTFSRTLKKLTLRFCEVPQTILDAIGTLPQIQVLKLTCCSFESSDWEPSEDGFCQLQYLEITGSNLENWWATYFHFPVLQHLILYDCPYLHEIPLDIVEINTLESIEVDECKPSVFDSAKKILEEQRQHGSTRLQLLLGREIHVDEQEEDKFTCITKVGNHGLSYGGCNLSHTGFFPQYLRRLILQFCDVSQTVLYEINVLPEIRVLKLTYCRFESSTWEPCDDGFFKLHYLEISHSNLENWLAADYHFPVLRNLIFDGCPLLSEIPFPIGEINTLKFIKVDACKPSVFDSAKRILEEQHQFGSNLQLRLGSAIDDSEVTEKKMMIMKKMLEEMERRNDDDDDDDDDSDDNDDADDETG